jgi:hypothetical protein
VKWLSGILLVVTLAAATLAFSLGQLTVRDRAVPVLTDVLRITLLPGDGGSDLSVRTGAAYQAGEPLMLLPGVEAYADPTELGTFSVDQAVNRIAGVLAGTTVDGGRAAALALVSDPTLSRQLEQAYVGPVPALVQAELEAQMLPSGLEDGSRLADWRTQAANKPGEPVQPIVGVFVYTDPNRLARLDDRQIGVLVVSGLAQALLQDGQAATREKITNSNLLARYDEAVVQGIPASLHQLFVTLLVAQGDTIASRLAEAKAVLAGDAQKTEELRGLLPSSQLAGLTPEQANRAVLDALAQRSYDSGSASVVGLLNRTDQAGKLERVARLLDALGGRAHRRYLTWTWISGLLALLFLVLVLSFSTGLSRLVNAGLATALAAAGGAWAFDRLGTVADPAVALPGGATQQGVLGSIASLVRYAAAAVPPELWELPRRNHLLVLALGGVLIVLALLLWLLRGVRPRRRSLL